MPARCFPKIPNNMKMRHIGKELSLGMFIHNFISKDVEGFRRLSQRSGVGEMHVFGSAGREDFDAMRSDIDVMVEVNEDDPPEKGENCLAFGMQGEPAYSLKPDLLRESSHRNPYLRKQVEATKKRIFDGTIKTDEKNH